MISIDIDDFRARTSEPRHDPLCGRCGGPSGPEGAWCDQCINECREHTLWLNNQAGGDQA
jgi:hypothetical protein